VDALGSHVVGSSYIVLEGLSSLKAVSRSLDVGPGQVLGCAEVDQLYLVLVVEQDVLGL
jgi:hypothetical protein